MTKAELAEKVASQCGFTKMAAEKAIETIFAEIGCSDITTLRGFGTFQWKTRAARDAMNPKTGKRIKIPEIRVFKFKPSKKVGVEDLNGETEPF